MTMNISFSSETEAKLRHHAAATGRNMSEVVVEAVEEMLQCTAASRDADGQWSTKLHAWAASHPTLDYIAADSRRDIYAGRDE